ncbi:hypothetical protein FLX56_28110 [Synechococcus moorigangaii CMS01]|nr:hypothetical protein [Synechococcus moorigangaii CMS01]
METPVKQDFSPSIAPVLDPVVAGIDSNPEEEIFDFFVIRLQALSLDEFLGLFRAFFIDHDEAKFPEALKLARDQMILANQRVEFVDLLQRCAYLFIECCLNQKEPQRITQLANLFTLPIELTGGRSPFALGRLHDWLRGFVNSDNCRIFRALANSSSTNHRHWGDRYLVFTLFAQSVNPALSPEQQRVSGLLYQLLSNRYRFRLVMYLSTKGNMTATGSTIDNPTLIEDVTLNLIHRLVVKKDPSYPEIAAQFLAESWGCTLAQWQPQLVDYLFAGMTSPRRLKWLPSKFQNYLSQHYPHGTNLPLDQGVVNYVCRDLIDYLLDPCYLQDLSHPLPVLMIQREYLTLSILLLKLVLLAPQHHARLLQTLGVLLGKYQDYPKTECQWLRGFLETIQVILALVLTSPQYCPLKAVPQGEHC